MTEPDIFDALRPVLMLFEELNVSHYVGGSLASSTWGRPRLTNDADVDEEALSEAGIK